MLSFGIKRKHRITMNCLKLILVVSITLAGMTSLSASQKYSQVHLSLIGQNYSTNVALNLEEIGDNVNNSLYCVTSLTLCCRTIDTGKKKASGSWTFPGGSLVPSRSGRTAGIVRTRGPSSVILHRLSNESAPTGIYYCEIPDGAGIKTRVFAHLYYETIPDLKVNICLKEYNQLVCTVHGGLVASYSWIVNGSDYYHGLFEENQIINYTTVTSQLIFSGNNSADFVGILQCIILDGNGRISSDFLQINEVSSRNISQTSSCITEDSSRVNTLQTTRNTRTKSPSPNATTVIIAVILSIVIITIPIILIILVLYFRKLCNEKKEKTIPVLRSEGALHNFITSNLNDMQYKNDEGQLYSEVSEHTMKKSEEKSSNSIEEKNDEVSVYYSTVKSREELNSQSEVVRNDFDRYTAVVATAKWKTKLQEETTSLYDTVY